MSGEVLYMACQCSGCQQVVRIQENKIVTSRGPDTAVAGCGGALIFLIDILDGRPHTLSHGSSVVCGAVVHDNDFYCQPVFFLTQHAVDGVGQEATVIVAGDND